jgi:hypothetical protein
VAFGLVPVELVAERWQLSLNFLPFEQNRFSLQIAAMAKLEAQIIFCSFMSST